MWTVCTCPASTAAAWASSAAFTPEPDEVTAAEATLDALGRADILDGGTAVLPDGRFVDRAMADSARRTLALKQLTHAMADSARETP